jgi:hypothetical protein
VQGLLTWIGTAGLFCVWVSWLVMAAEASDRDGRHRLWMGDAPHAALSATLQGCVMAGLVNWGAGRQGTGLLNYV